MSVPFCQRKRRNTHRLHRIMDLKKCYWTASLDKFKGVGGLGQMVGTS